MKPRRGLLPVVLAATLMVPACVEITGQRITWFHDEAQDKLHILIHYDGIHEADTDKRKGSEQIPAFVDDGDMMLLDWPFHVQREKLRELSRSGDSPVERDAAELVLTTETRVLGQYREPDGRIGAVQLVSIAGVSDFVTRLNRLISQAVLSLEEGAWPGLPRTLARVRDAAAEGQEWIALRGHSIRATMPVHPGEWSMAKASVLRGVFDTVIQQSGQDPDQRSESAAATLVRLIGSAPWSYLDEGNRVTLVLGRPDQPTTVRLFVRDEYETNLEQVVTDSVPVDLDAALAHQLLADAEPVPDELAPLLDWGPPEDQVRALLAAASGKSEAERRRVAERLARWGAAWNRDHGVPQATLELDPDQFTTAWARWYQQVVSPDRNDQ